MFPTHPLAPAEVPKPAYLAWGHLLAALNNSLSKHDGWEKADRLAAALAEVTDFESLSRALAIDPTAVYLVPFEDAGTFLLAPVHHLQVKETDQDGNSILVGIRGLGGNGDVFSVLLDMAMFTDTIKLPAPWKTTFKSLPDIVLSPEALIEHLPPSRNQPVAVGMVAVVPPKLFPTLLTITEWEPPAILIAFLPAMAQADRAAASKARLLKTPPPASLEPGAAPGLSVPKPKVPSTVCCDLLQFLWAGCVRYYHLELDELLPAESPFRAVLTLVSLMPTCAFHHADGMDDFFLEIFARLKRSFEDDETASVLSSGKPAAIDDQVTPPVLAEDGDDGSTAPPVDVRAGELDNDGDSGIEEVFVSNAKTTGTADEPLRRSPLVRPTYDADLRAASSLRSHASRRLASAAIRRAVLLERATAPVAMLPIAPPAAPLTAPPTAPPAPAGLPPIVAGGDLPQIVAMFNRDAANRDRENREFLLQMMATFQSPPPTVAQTPATDVVATMLQQTVCFASTVDGVTSGTLTPLMVSLSKPGIKSTDAHQLIRLALRPERVHGFLFLGTAIALARGQFEWRCSELPSNLSLFSVASTECHKNLREAHDEDLQRQIQNEHGLGLEQRDVEKLTKEFKPRGPRSIYELIDQLKSFRALIKVLLGEGLIFLHIDQLVNWVEDNRDPIAHHQYEHNLYCRLAYAIDLRFYALFQRISCAPDMQACCFGMTDFSDLERNIQNRAFRPPGLPACLREDRQQP